MVWSTGPEGFEFDLAVVVARSEGEDELLDPMLFGPGPHRLRRGGGEVPDAMLRIGVQFADGRKATNTGGFSHFPPRTVCHEAHPLIFELCHEMVRGAPLAQPTNRHHWKPRRVAVR